METSTLRAPAAQVDAFLCQFKHGWLDFRVAELQAAAEAQGVSLGISDADVATLDEGKNSPRLLLCRRCSALKPFLTCSSHATSVNTDRLLFCRLCSASTVLTKQCHTNLHMPRLRFFTIRRRRSLPSGALRGGRRGNRARRAAHRAREAIRGRVGVVSAANSPPISTQLHPP